MVERDVEENIPVVFPKTIYEGYVWDCYTHISDVYSSGYVNAYPVTDDGYLKIGDESGEFESMIASRGDKYYLWSYNDDGATKGVVTRKRNPLKMEISDIVGEYIIDDGGVGINRYLGLQNIEDNVNKHNWVGILSDRSNGYDTLIIQWRTIDNNSGVDTLTFVDELDDIFFVDETVTHNVVWDNRVCKSVSFTGSGTAVNPFYDSQSDYYLQIGTDSDKYVYFNLLHSGIVTIKLECKNAKLDYSGSTATHTVSDNILNNVAKLRVEIYDKLGHFVERKQITPRCYTTANTNSSKEEYNTVSFNLPRGQYSFAIDILGAYYGPFGYKGSDSESAELLTYWDLTYDIYEVVSDDIDTSTSLNGYCYNFSNSGYIDITITNNGNYLMDGEEIANGSISTPITSTIQLYNNMGVLVSSTHVYPPSPSAIRRGETEKTVTIVIPSAGTYYIKYMMNIFYYNMTKGEDAILQVKDCQLKSYWSIYVDAVEYNTNSNMCISYRDYLKYWYEKSGKDQNFHPNNRTAEFGCWGYDWIDKGLETRMLWNSGDNITDSSNVDLIFPTGLRSLHYEMPIYKTDELEDNQLIRVKDIPNFKLFNLSIEKIKYPDVIGDGDTIITYNKLDSGDLVWNCAMSYDNVFMSHSEEYCNYIQREKTYYDPNVVVGVPDNISISFEVESHENKGIIDDISYTPTIDVTFANDIVYSFNVVSKKHTEPEDKSSVDVDLMGYQWVPGSTTKIYMSASNYNVANGVATMKIIIKGYKKFSFYIRSYAESIYDYMMVSQLDKDISGTTRYDNTTLVKAHTRGNQKPSSVDYSNWTLVTYDNIEYGEHTITIVYRKNENGNVNDDRGYVWLVGDSEPYLVVTSDIYAMCGNTEGFKMDEICTISKIDYSGLHFTTVGSSQPDPEETYYKLYYLNYWIGAGTNKRIYLSQYANDLQIKSYSGDFISLDGLTTYVGNVPFDIAGSGTNTYLKFSSNNVSAVLGRDCYFRVACSDQYSGQTIYPCFRVVFNSNGVVNMINTRIGDCTLWMGNSSAGNSIYMANRSSDTSLKIYPLSGAYTNGKTVGGYLYNTFAHGFFNGSSAWSNFTLNYISDAFATIDAECSVGEVVSLISPRCSTFTDIITYMYMAPSVDVSVYS